MNFLSGALQGVCAGPEETLELHLVVPSDADPVRLRGGVPGVGPDRSPRIWRWTRELPPYALVRAGALIEIGKRSRCTPSPRDCAGLNARLPCSDGIDPLAQKTQLLSMGNITCRHCQFAPGSERHCTEPRVGLLGRQRCVGVEERHAAGLLRDVGGGTSSCLS